MRAEAGTIQTSAANASESTSDFTLSGLFSRLRPWLHQLITGEELQITTNESAEAQNSVAERVIRDSLNGDLLR